MNLKIRLAKFNPDGVVAECVAGFKSFAHSVLHLSMILRTFALISKQLGSQVEAYTGQESGRTIGEILKCKPTSEGTYM